MGNPNSEHLERLVLTFLHQNNPMTILEDEPPDQRAAIFLTRIGWGQQRDYIEDALNSYLFGALPDGQIYAFTPNDSFKYRKSGSRIGNDSMDSRMDSRRSSESTFNDALDDIIQHIEPGRESAFPALFFDEASFQKFEMVLKHRLQEKSKELRGENAKKRYAYSPRLEMLHVPNYGSVNLYHYTINL